MSIIQRVPWKVQPPHGTPLNPYWELRGLVAFFDVVNGRELISGDKATTNTTTRKAGRFGQAAAFSGSQQQQYAHRAAYAQTDAMTLLALVERSASAAQTLMMKGVIAVTGCPYWWSVGTGVADKVEFWQSNGAGAYIGKQGSLASIVSSYSGLMGYTIPKNWATSGDFPYASGTLESSVLSAGSDVTPVDDGTSDVWIGRRNNSTQGWTGNIYFTALFSQELSAAEMRALANNPWILFAPQTRRIWEPVSAGGGGGATLFRSRTISGSRAGSRRVA